MAHRTITPELLNSVFKGFKTSFQKGFSGYTPMWQQLATLVPSANREETYGWMGDMPKMREWIGDRVINGLKAHGYSIRNRKFENTIGVSRDDIEDDSVGLYAPRFEMLGQATAQHPDEIIFLEIVKGAFANKCYDGQSFFDTDHPVGPAGNITPVSNMQAGAGEPWMLLALNRPLKPFIFQRRRDYDFQRKEDANTSDHVFMRDEYVYGVDARVAAGYGFWQMGFGSKATLDATNLRAAYTAMTSFTDDYGRPLGIVPTHLMVGNTNHFAGRDILLAERNAAGASNTNMNLVQLMHAPLVM